uniref:arylsulfatase A isoform X2 n=1 Tax=Monopterus albus TaxID=43700 RepID=UPI0009B31A2B|nr:arylsulfatase A isoform X2 [Monopterus albus]
MSFLTISYFDVNVVRRRMGYISLLILNICLFCTCSASPPNFVLLFADDLGFGDLGCYGHPSSLTASLDGLAARGLRFTNFYCTSPVCSPSRASLLTGRYQTRSGVYPGVFYPGSIGGLPLNETTIAEGPCGNLTCFPPDVKCFGTCDVDTVTVPLMYNEVIKQQPVNFLELEKAYSDFATNFITTSAEKKQPFFLYYPSHHTHYPQYAGPGAAGLSLRGPFGDALLEFDNTVGHLLTTLEKTGVINNTLVFFTSDNGPETMRMSRGGNAGSLKCGKGTTYDGGMREPAIAYWPGTIRPGVTHEMASTLDILPTFTSLAGAKLPQVMLDGVDMTEILLKHGKSKRETIMFYPTDPSEKYGLFALRLGKYKAHFYTQGSTHSATTPDYDCSPLTVLEVHDPPLIFDLEADPSENYPLSLEGRPDLQAVLEKIKIVKKQFEASMVFGESQISKGTDPKLEPCCNPQCSPKPRCCHC